VVTRKEGGAAPSAGPGQQAQGAIDPLHAEIAELRRSRRRLVEAAAADRRALEREIHDGLQQQLAALAIEVRRLAGLMDGEPAAARALLDEIAVSVRDALTEATTLAQRLHPPLLDGRGLVASIRSAAQMTGVTVMVDAPGGTAAPPDTSAAVYWACLEALSSASGGSEATVSLRAEDGGLVFEVAIAGSLPTARIERLRDRVEAFDGRLSVDAEPSGSRVHGWLPISR
jgi:signal transduction histidine kinase